MNRKAVKLFAKCILSDFHKLTFHFCGLIRSLNQPNESSPMPTQTPPKEKPSGVPPPETIPPADNESDK